jgi:polyferredoxin
MKIIFVSIGFLIIIVFALWSIDSVVSKFFPLVKYSVPFFGRAAIESRRRKNFRRELSKARTRKRRKEILIYVVKVMLILFAFIVALQVVLFFHQNGFE